MLLTTFSNQQPLLRGTPVFGIDFLGDKANTGIPIPSILVSSADNATRPTNTGFEIVRADNGVTRYVKSKGFTQTGAIAFDLVQATDSSQPARILAWGALDQQTSYDQGHFQVYLLNQQAGQVTLVPNMNLNEEPVLLNFDALNRRPEEIGVGGNEVSVFNAIIKSNNRRAMLTFPKTNPPETLSLFVNAYDVDDFTQRLTNASLEGSLLAVAAPGELPLDAPGTSNGSTLVILHQESLANGQKTNSIIFKGVTSDTTWHLVRGSLLSIGS